MTPKSLLMFLHFCWMCKQEAHRIKIKTVYVNFVYSLYLNLLMQVNIQENTNMKNLNIEAENKLWLFMIGRHISE